MYRSVPRHTAFTWLAYLLLVIPNTSASAEGLREQAASYRQQGYEAQRRGDRANALSNYQKAAALDPSYPTPQNDIGVLLEEEGRLQEAEQAYQQALTLDPNYLDPYANLAMLYERMGEKEKAIYYWMKRYQLGEASDQWTIRAEERLLALGVLKDHPELKGKMLSSRRLVEQEFQAHAKSRDDFNAVSQAHGDWPVEKAK